MINVQREITLRAIELLLLPHDQTALILDVGCGSGLSGNVLEEKGHIWVGCDVSRDMLGVAHERMEESFRMDDIDDDDKDDEEMDDDEDADGDDAQRVSHNRPSTGDLMHHDMGTGLPFRPATFDACISISALQWLCYSNSAAQVPKRRLIRFFSSLYSVLKKGGRAVLQFYPETAEQAVLISECATAVGFAGGIVVDYPNSAKAKKRKQYDMDGEHSDWNANAVLSFFNCYHGTSNQRKLLIANLYTPRHPDFLVLSCDRTPRKQLPQGLTSEDFQQSHVQVSAKQQHGGNSKGKLIRKKKGVKTKEWILQKKETQRKKGKSVRPDTKYTARKRPTKF
jgi:18S rRNA (guanine1575-N7)-methyltransferase